MADPLREISAPQDGKGRLISIFVGAVLMPSLALSYVSIDFVPELAKGRQALAIKQAERALYYIEKDLAQIAQTQALEAARAVGAERLLEGRMEAITQALREAGLEPGMFKSLRLEGSSPGRVLPRKGREAESPRDLLWGMEAASHAVTGEEKVPWANARGTVSGILRFRYAPSFVHGRLLRRYFEKEFASQDPAVVVRVSEPSGRVLYETAPTPDDRFEVYHVMQTPSFRGLKLALRNKDLSIEQGIRWWEIGTLAVIGFIDLMLAAGLYLVYSNVRREVHLA
ncbi:MAG TPA: hypothetical protein VMR21_08450, partial [Vicinamibacteria bacterium]|nr:hypothetical protein [Vicinamibacteria bacterium]